MKPHPIKQTIHTFFFGEVCSSCYTAFVYTKHSLCASCLQKISLVTEPTCPQCGEPLLANKRCVVCASRRIYIDDFFYLFHLNKEATRLLHQAKFEKRKKAISFILQNLSHLLPQLPKVDVVLPLPSSSAFVQKVARYMAKELKVLTLDVFQKKKSTQKIKFLSRAKRFAQIEASIVLQQKLPASIKKVLLLDDVWTTGATMNFCAKTLANTQALHIVALTLFRKPGFLEEGILGSKGKTKASPASRANILT